MLTFGDATIETIKDMDPFALPIDLLFPHRTIADLLPLKSALEPHHVDFASGRILLGVHSHLLRVAGKTILIDTCIGEHKPRPLRSGDWHQRRNSGYLQGLARHGLQPGDIDIVLCTHLHADHVGWNTRLIDGQWVPTFPKARYLFGKTEFDHWLSAERQDPGKHNHGSFTDSVMPILDAGQMDFVGDGDEIAPGLTLKAMPGHSPGQLGACLCHGDSRLLFCADAIHSVIQVYKPDWCSRFCSDRDSAIATRRQILEEAADSDTVIIPAHLRHYAGFRVRREEGGGFSPHFVTS